MKLFRRKTGEKAPDLRNVLLPPEGVPLNFDVAGVGVRIGAQLADVLITFLAGLAIVLFLSAIGLLSWYGTFGLLSLVFFFIRVPYYPLSELLWNGQTIGKRLLRIKVVANDGGPLTTHAIVTRNLMKEAEVFLPGTLLLSLDAEAPLATIASIVWIATCLAVPLFNKRRRRFGDYIAGTYVIHLPTPLLLKDLAKEAPVTTADDEEAYVFLAHHLDHYGAFELQTLEGLLRAQIEKAPSAAAHTRQEATRAVVVEKIRKKIGYADAIPPERGVEFLMTFYNAQRAHLEQKQLFGERRADKHHAKTPEEEH